MSPVPLIELQRRLAEAGRIRMGEKKRVMTKEGERDVPERLTSWRLTSPTKHLIEQAAEKYGGTVKPWTAPTGEQWEVITGSTELPVLVMPAYSLNRQYELWEGPSKCSRRCDGVTEWKSDQPCLCNAEQKDRCELHTRLTVVLPELSTMLGWRLESKGMNAAAELDTSLELIRGISRGAPFVPARLRIVERKGQKDGKATRYVVPVIDPAISFAELAAEQPLGLPAYTPAERRPGLGVGDALDVTARQIEGRGRSEPIGPAGEMVDAEPIPVPDAAPPTKATPQQLQQIKDLVASAADATGKSKKEVQTAVREMAGCDSKDLTDQAADELIGKIERWIENAKRAGEASSSLGSPDASPAESPFQIPEGV